ncbi:MAG: twin-arginine translocase TatA/TatE family subunit [Anaerolineales bacterium]|nr:twin-arginine translocase TatA/TatE family subunit [Anaerolineales bacterium]
MPIRLGTPELLLILGIVVLIFGVGRLGRIGGELGTAIRNFRQGMAEKDSDKPSEPAKTEDKS